MAPFFAPRDGPGSLLKHIHWTYTFPEAASIGNALCGPRATFQSVSIVACSTEVRRHP